MTKDIKTLDGLQACVKRMKPHRTAAKKLEENIRKMGISPYKGDLMYASGRAFACVYCSGDGTACDETSKRVNLIDANLAKDGKLPK